jgi:hypothetical protein
MPPILRCHMTLLTVRSRRGKRTCLEQWTPSDHSRVSGKPCIYVVTLVVASCLMDRILDRPLSLGGAPWPIMVSVDLVRTELIERGASVVAVTQERENKALL